LNASEIAELKLRATYIDLIAELKLRAPYIDLIAELKLRAAYVYRVVVTGFSDTK
jgi:hypothetical protein